MSDTAAHKGDDPHPPAGFEPLANATEVERFNGPFFIRKDEVGAVIGFRAQERHMNAAGTCHGGVLSVFADMQGYALAVGNFSGAAPTITLGIDFLAPVRFGDWVEATPEVTRDTKSLTFFQGMMRVEGAPVARSNGIYKKRPTGQTTR
ncbi:MAG: PaaI family thioesterase [Maritimibacter sp.]